MIFYFLNFLCIFFFLLSSFFHIGIFGFFVFFYDFGMIF